MTFWRVPALAARVLMVIRPSPGNLARRRVNCCPIGFAVTITKATWTRTAPLTKPKTAPDPAPLPRHHFQQ